MTQGVFRFRPACNKNVPHLRNDPVPDDAEGEWASKPSLSLLLAIFIMTIVAGPAFAQEGLVVIPPESIPDHVGGGVGFAPDYVGSDNYFIGSLPVARVSRGHRYLQLLGNSLYGNVLDAGRLEFGPVGVYRFGREDVDDQIVSRLSEIDDTIDLGLFAGAELLGLSDPRKRLWTGISAQHDILGKHQGYTVDVTARLWWPVADWLQLGLFGAVTYGSGDYMSTFFGVSQSDSTSGALQSFKADAGFRDARITASFITEVAPSWFVGAGLMYQRLLGDAADTPIVSSRGSANQLYGGVGFVYAWPP
ncbi:outer membrane protein [Skermanella aerolata]|uniref:MipA/OmpV family protein n=1 Tax=Skermanella aerolata TaxID=393310 RepID=UPI003D1CC8D7